MSKVNEKRDAEARRIAERADKESRKSADKKDGAKFGERMNQTRQSQAGQKQLGARDKLNNLRQKMQKNAKSEGKEARSALLARGGIKRGAQMQKKSARFEQKLSQAGAESNEATRTQGEERSERAEGARTETQERVTDLDNKKEAKKESEQELTRAEENAKGKHNAAISGGGKKGGSSSGQEGERSDASGLKAGEAGGAKEAAGAQEIQAHEVQEIPEEILKALTDNIYLGVNAEGLAEFQVELKEGVLDGGMMKVTAGDDGIRLAFQGLDTNAQRLLKASEGEIHRRLGKKGLRLASLVVE